MGIDMTLRVPAIEKLVDYAASGVGAIAGPMLANWRASREGQARLTSTQVDAEARHIETESKAKSLQIIAAAQAKARQSIDTTLDPGRGIVQITRDDMIQSIEFQDRKRLSNVISVVEGAADELGNKDVSDRKPNHDWSARFFDEIQDISSEEMQTFWAKVLAGEVQRPGSTSIHTLSILRNFDQAIARLFEKFCSACVSLRPDENNFLDARVLSLGGNAGSNALEKYGLGFRNLNVLNEQGLIISDYHSWFDYRFSIRTRLPGITQPVVSLPFTFQGRNWVLLPTTERAADQPLKLSGVALTRSGQELSRIINLAPMKEYTQALMEFFEAKGLQMTEFDGPIPE